MGYQGNAAIKGLMDSLMKHCSNSYIKKLALKPLIIFKMKEIGTSSALCLYIFAFIQLNHEDVYVLLTFALGKCSYSWRSEPSCK